MSERIYLVTREIFYALTSAIVLFIVLELIHPKMVLAYINLNILLLVWVFNGIIIVLIKKK